MLVSVYVACSYPLHPGDNYHGIGWLRWQRHIPADVPIDIHTVWQDFSPGEWHWCPRCTRRNALRSAHMTKMLERWKGVKYTRQDPKQHRRGPIIVGDRFAGLQHQAMWAKKHAPDGMFWCTRGLHYVDITERSNVRSPHCHTCYELSYIRRGFEAHQRLLRNRDGVYDEAVALAEKRAELRREIGTLRRELVQVKALLEQEAGMVRDKPDVWMNDGGQDDIIITPANEVHNARPRRRAFAV